MAQGRKPNLKAIIGGLSAVPALPDGVPADMADEWKVIATDMARRKILSDSGLGVLTTYVIALWTVREAQAAIAKHGVLVEAAARNLKPNPACALLARALEAVARLSAELGLTPAARSKAGFQPKEPADDGAPTGLDI